MTNSVARDDIEVWISTSKAVVVTRERGGFDGGGEVETQSKTVEKVLDAVKVSSSEFIESWKKASDAVEALFTADEKTGEPSGFGLESVTAKLSLTASGKVCFVGELGGEVAIEAVFKRRSTR
jgi:hypothetical protein